MVATRSHTTNAPRRNLRTIFDAAGALHSPTPVTPVINAQPAASTAQADFLTHCAGLRKGLFDASVAKYVLRKVTNDKTARFGGHEPRPSDLWARLISELRSAFVAEHASFSPLFQLDDATIPVRREANELLFSAVANIVDPESAAGAWVEASAMAFPDDGKRAILEVVRRLHDARTPMASTKELIDVKFASGIDPSENIAKFNYALRESSRRTTWDQEEVKDLFLAGLDRNYYAPVLDEFIRHDQREAVDLLTMQQRVMAVYAAKKAAPDPHPRAAYAGAESPEFSDVLEALDALRREVRALKHDRGFTPRSDKRHRDSEDSPQGMRNGPRGPGKPGWRVGLDEPHPCEIPGGNYSQSTKVQYERGKKKFIPFCKHPRCRPTAAKHYRSDCPHAQANIHYANFHEDALAELYQQAYDDRDHMAFH
ncbi:hypothetical protein CYMTET_47483 [Cymbomonas tetramitiformis]|uniref:Uncharacterized protein n=1 Tax=Cymbomonas tetramitiformis TaxID=36881 RepID=A0AAE0EVY3_9CHLO|nr:hypothetical protein CYMTET_47483 [Cymbomonas tetramitiformis]